MSKEVEKKTIAKKRYVFKKGYQQLTLANKNKFRDDLMQLLQISGKTYFSTILNSGIVSLTKKYAITELFKRYGITEIWEEKEK